MKCPNGPQVVINNLCYENGFEKIIMDFDIVFLIKSKFFFIILSLFYENF